MTNNDNEFKPGETADERLGALASGERYAAPAAAPEQQFPVQPIQEQHNPASYAPNDETIPMPPTNQDIAETQAYAPLPTASEAGATQVFSQPVAATQPLQTAAAATPAAEEATQVFQPAAAQTPAAMPPSITPTSTGDADGDENEPKKKSHVGAIIGGIIAALVVLALIIGGCFMWWRYSNDQKTQAAALSDCKSAVQKVDDAKSDLNDAISAGKTAAQVSSDQVADQNTITKLNTALEDASKIEDTPACTSSMSTDDLNTALTSANKQLKTVTGLTTTITDDAKAVEASKVTKTQDDLKDKLSAAVKAASSLLDSSKDKVQDDATRTALNDAITAANTVLNGSSLDENAVNDAITKLTDASNKVNDSIKAKTDAEEDISNRSGGAGGDPEETNIGNRSGGAGSDEQTDAGDTAGNNVMNN